MFIGDYNPRLDMLGWTRLCIQGLSKRGVLGISLPTFITGLLDSWEWRERREREKGWNLGRWKEKTHYNSAPIWIHIFQYCLQCLLMSCLIKTLLVYFLSEFGAEGQLVDELQDCIRKWGLRMTSSNLSWDIRFLSFIWGEWNHTLNYELAL